MISAGIDAGSRAVKVVLWDMAQSEIIATGMADQGVDQAGIARALYEDVLARNGLGMERVERVVATGYGRYAVEFADKAITEITCHACGVRKLASEAKTIIDIGGQDSKLIRLDDSGAVQDFMMNDRCAAGTGRFLEVVADRLHVGLNELGGLAERSRNHATISAMCVVFAETEIIGLLASGTPPEDIVAGVQAAIVTRVSSMAGHSIEPPIVFVGGVARIPGMGAAFQSALADPVTVPALPQMTGALGAAILAARK